MILFILDYKLSIQYYKTHVKNVGKETSTNNKCFYLSLIQKLKNPYAKHFQVSEQYRIMDRNRSIKSNLGHKSKIIALKKVDSCWFARIDRTLPNRFIALL